MEQNKQEWLLPEVGESIEEYKRRGIGRKVSEGKTYPVPNIVMDGEARKVLLGWPMEISARRIVINKPFAHFAELEPDVVFDSEESNGNVTKIEFKMGENNTIEMIFSFKKGEAKSLYLTLEENGQIRQSF